MTKILLFLCALMSFGCVAVDHFQLENKLDEFSETSRSYESAIEWSDFLKAASFISQQNLTKEQAVFDKDFLKKIKVTSYEVQYLKMNAEKTKVEQTVEIKYYNKDYLIEKVIDDNQVWIYESDFWRLTTGLPVFK